MIITLKGADFSASNIGTLDSWFISWSGSGLTAASGNAASIKKDGTSTTTLTYTYNTENYEYVSGTVKDATGATVGNISTSNGTVTVTINAGNTIRGKITIAIVMEYIKIDEEPDGGTDTPVNPPSGDTGTTWYINSLDQIAATGKDLTKGTYMTTDKKYVPWAFPDSFNNKLVGKTINAIEIVPNKAGAFHCGKYNNSTGTYTSMGVFTISESDLNVRKIYQFAPYSIASGEYFTFNEDGDTGATAYFLAKDVDTTAVECVDKMYQACENGEKANFTYSLVVIMNVGYIGENDDSGSSGGSGDSGNTGGSDNTTWYINSLKQLQDSGNDINANKVKLAANSGYHWAFNQFNSKLAGKTINTIELMPCENGTFTIGIFDTSSNTVTDTRSIPINADDIDTIKTYTFDDLTIPADKYFVWNCSGYSNNDGEAAGYYILKAKLDPLAVETSQWYQAKSTGLAAFGTHELAFIANIGYTE